MAQILGVSHTAINKVMKELSDYNAVQATRIGNAIVWRIKTKSMSYSIIKQYLNLDKSSLDLVIEKICSEIKNLFSDPNTGETDAWDLIDLDMVTRIPPVKMYIIGSVAEGASKNSSDIDLVIITFNDDIKKFINESKVLDNLKIWALEEVGNELSIHMYLENKIQKQPELHWVQDAIKRGIKVYP